MLVQIGQMHDGTGALQGPNQISVESNNSMAEPLEPSMTYDTIC